uniref:OTU domain-containing protein n=1 Tax=Leptobrachium leishanense TaxID=445787 RepID=A0A8C5WJ07_9ANUR
MDKEEELTGAAAVLKQQQQRREKKELQAKIQSMKNSVPKNKKRRKQLTDDIVKLEAEMEERHKQELDEATRMVSRDSACISDTIHLVFLLECTLWGIIDVALEAEQREEEEDFPSSQGPSLYANSIPTCVTFFQALVGYQVMTQVALPVPPIHLLWQMSCIYVLLEVRFVFPFKLELLKLFEFEWEPNTGVFSSSLTANTPAWGGQLELRALSHILQAPIEVIQADSPLIVIGEEYSIRPITLVYIMQLAVDVQILGCFGGVAGEVVYIEIQHKNCDQFPHPTAAQS